VLFFNSHYETKQVESFLGLTEYFRQFQYILKLCVHYPIFKKKKKNNVKFQFEDEQKCVHFRKAKRAASSREPLLKLYRIDADSLPNAILSRFSSRFYYIKRDSRPSFSLSTLLSDSCRL